MGVFTEFVLASSSKVLRFLAPWGSPIAGRSYSKEVAATTSPTGISAAVSQHPSFAYIFYRRFKSFPIVLFTLPSHQCAQASFLTSSNKYKPNRLRQALGPITHSHTTGLQDNTREAMCLPHTGQQPCLNMTWRPRAAIHTHVASVVTVMLTVTVGV